MKNIQKTNKIFYCFFFFGWGGGGGGGGISPSKSPEKKTLGIRGFFRVLPQGRPGRSLSL